MIPTKKDFLRGGSSRAGVCFLIAASLTASAWAGPIQDAIDAAKPGDVVQVPAGVYQEALVVRDGVTLQGEGPKRSIVQAPPTADCAVAMGKQSALIGLGVRGGKTAVLSDRNFIGLFDCHIVGAGVAGVRLIYGSAAIYNCVISGNATGTGVLCLGSNPVVADCTIGGWTNGAMAWHKYTPVLRGNIIRDNACGLVASKDTPVVFENNIFWNNEEADVKGCDFAPTLADAEPEDNALREPYRDVGVEGYLDLMLAVYVKQVAHHPVVTYALGEDLGEFRVGAAFDWADFIVSASTTDTDIAACRASDTHEDAPLPARRDTVAERPSVRVEGALQATRDTGRYVMDGLYVHAPSYAQEKEGVRVFVRETSFSHIRVVAPAGWKIASCEPEGTVTRRADGLCEARITEVGLTNVRVRMVSAEGE